MKNDYLVIKKEELISILKEMFIGTEVKLHPESDASSVMDSINALNSDIDALELRLNTLERTNYYTGRYEAMYFKIPKPFAMPKELEIRATYYLTDTTKPSQQLAAVSAFYISKPFIDRVTDTGILNLATNKTGISYLSSIKFTVLKNRTNQDYYIKMEIGARKAPNTTLGNMCIFTYSMSQLWEIKPESQMGGVLSQLDVQISRDTELEAETLRREVRDIDKLVRSDDYSFIKSLTQAQFETMKQNETLQEGVLYTTDKVEED